MTDLTGLSRYLADLDRDEATFSFEEIEGIIGQSLPDSARRHRSWWANGGHAHARAWLAAGFRARLPGIWPDGVGFVRAIDQDEEGEEPRVEPTSLAQQITAAFTAAKLDLAARPGASRPGWDALPEVIAASKMTALGATPVDVRLFLTFCTAMDRGRQDAGLWEVAIELFKAERWTFLPGVVIKRPLRDLIDALRTHNVSLRHERDATDWRLIAEALNEPVRARDVHRAVFAGAGIATTLLQALEATTTAGTQVFPLLSLPTVGPRWVRMLVMPGGADIGGLSELPLVVDAPIRQASRHLGLPLPPASSLEEARPAIQAAWAAEVEAHGADGPAALAGTCAALEPALTFFAEWGCATCERERTRLPIAGACAGCRIGEREEAQSALVS